MKIKIHRGTHQIGGCITEIRTEKTRLIIDFGTQLPYRNGKIPEENLEIEGVTLPGKEGDFDGVLFTHYHSDHTGLMGRIREGIPLYMGQGAKEIFLLSQSHKDSKLVSRIRQIESFTDGHPFFAGDIKVTPILTDHSAFDAYMLLFEAEGKRVLHTGDFRLHGIKGDMVVPRLEAYRGTIDLLITEGTNLSYEDPVVTSEYLLAMAAKVLMERYPYVFAICGSEDIDRLAVFHQAAEKKNCFLCDSYQMSILAAAAEFGGGLTELYRFDKARVYREDIESIDNGFCMTVREGEHFAKIMKSYREKHNEKSLVIYSMSEGHLKNHRHSVEKLTEGFRYVVKLHTSGHASAEAIWEVANAVAAGYIIPIHTENPEKIRLGALQDRVVFLEDGDTFEV